jgi:hypothetical protein
MREILTTTADDTARTTRFVQRTSPLSGATFRQTLVFGFLGNPQATLEELTQTAAALGVAISPQALDQRFTVSAAACLHQVLLTAIARVITAEPVTIPLLQRFTAVYVQDSSTIVLPEVFATQWHKPRQNLVYTSGYFIGPIQLAQCLKYQCLYVPDEPRQTIHML